MSRGARTPRTPAGLLITKALPVLNKGPALSTRPFDAPEALVPHTASRRYSWSHNGIMIPNLPEPLRYLSMTTIVGASGAPISDILHQPDHPGGPRNRASVNVSTGATAPGFWNGYRIDSECDLAPDGSRVAFGDEVALVGEYPSYRLVTSVPGLEVNLVLACTDVVSWFVHTPIYRHLSLLTSYQGTVTHEGLRYDVSGECAFEHARAIGSYNIARREVRHPWLRMALDFFTYQVVDLQDGRQLLLTSVEAEGRVGMNGAFLRSADGSSVSRVEGIDFVVDEYLPAAAVTPDGARMRLPRRFRWSSAPGGLRLDLAGAVDTPYSWGLGNGYVAGYSFQGTVDGTPVESNTGYIEYIDRRDWRRHATTVDVQRRLRSAVSAAISSVSRL